jgi:5-methylcytosine-specific restriction endonuclease McrA
VAPADVGVAGSCASAAIPAVPVVATAVPTVPVVATAVPAGAVPARNVPVAVRREVWKRSGGRCEWAFASGEICGSTVRLEYDHVAPRALGGPSRISNVRLLCRDHNQLAARLVYGDRWMDRYSRRPPAAVTAARP